MNTLTSNTLALPRRRRRPTQALAAATRTAIALLERIEGGSLRLILPDNSQRLLGHGAERATLQVNDERVFQRVLAEGDNINLGTDFFVSFRQRLQNTRQKAIAKFFSL